MHTCILISPNLYAPKSTHFANSITHLRIPTPHNTPSRLLPTLFMFANEPNLWLMVVWVWPVILDNYFQLHFPKGKARRQVPCYFILETPWLIVAITICFQY